MADIAGVALGTAALYALCTDLYRQITTEPMRIKAATYGDMLHVQELRFKLWGHAWGVREGLIEERVQLWGPNGRDIHTKIDAILQRITDTIIRAYKIEDRFEIEIVPELRALAEENTIQRRSVFVDRIHQALKSTLAKIRWSIGDQQKFQEMVNELVNMNDSLESLLPAASNPRSFQYQMVSLAYRSDGLQRDSSDMNSFSSAIADLKKISEQLNASVEALTMRPGTLNSPDPLLKGLEDLNLQLDGSAFTVNPNELRLLSLHHDAVTSLCDESADDNRALAIQGQEPVLVEFKPYSPEIKDTIKHRVQAQAIGLTQASKLDGFPFLTCAGYYEDPSEDYLRYVLTFRYPPAADVSRKPVSLSSALSCVKPTLGERFKLAHKLALGCLCMQLIDWVHKSLRPHNVLLFYTESRKGKRPRLAIENPRIVGFDYARPNPKDKVDQEPSNEAANPAPAHLPYRHPDTFLPHITTIARNAASAGSWTVPRGAKPRFKEYYDIYSFGIMLLEIGYWRPISKLCKLPVDREWTLEDFERLNLAISKAIADNEISHRMGVDYQAAVAECLQGPFEELPHGSEKAWFCECVVSPLSRYADLFGDQIR